MSKETQTVPIVEGYSLKEFIGTGGLGVVYRGTDPTGNTVAVKILRGSDDSSRSILENEFKTLSSLTHLHLIKVLDYGFLADSRPFLVMEYVEGEPISRRSFLSDDGRLDAANFARVVYQIVGALGCIHSQRLVHGDLKPSNILLSRDDNDQPVVTIMDFGLSRTMESDAMGLSGTFEYMAPELIRGGKTSPSSDLYALGCLLYELCAGTPPYTGATPREVLLQHLSSDPNFDALGSIPPAFRRWIETLLEKDPPRRYRTASQLALEASAYLGQKTDIQFEHPREPLRLPDISREREMAKLVELFHASRTRVRFFSLAGQDGMGKSRLLREIATFALIHGARVLRVQCSPGQREYRLMLELLSTIDREVLTETTSPYARTLVSIFPELAAVLAPDAGGLDVQDLAKDTLFHQAIELILAHLPVDVLLVDDLHDADALSREFLSSFIATCEARSKENLLLGVTYDPEVLEEDWRTTLEAEPFTLIQFPRLTQVDVETTLHVLIGENASRSFLSTMYQKSQGIPGRLEELLDFCISEGILEQTLHGWLVHERENLGMLFPSSIRELFERKLRNVQPALRDLLETVALSTGPVSRELASHVASIPLEQVTSMIVALEEKGLVEIRDEGSVDLHPLLRSLLVSEGKHSKELHQRYLQWIETALEQPREDVIAHHLLGSGQREAALPFLLRAASERIRLFDNSGAFALYSTALPLLRSPEHADERFEVLRSLAELSNALGKPNDEHEFLEEMLLLAAQSHSDAKLADVYHRQADYNLSLSEYDRARKSAGKALAYARSSRDRMGEARSYQKLGVIEYRTTPGESVLPHYEKALELYRELGEHADEGNLLVDIGLVYYSILEQPQKALDYFRQAVEVFERIGYQRGLIRAYGNIGAQQYSLGHFELALENYTRAADIARDIGDRRMLATGVGAMGQCELALCRYSAALLHLQEELRISREMSNLHLEELALENLGEVYMMLGVFDKAYESYSAALTIARNTGNRVGQISVNIDLAGVAMETGRHDDAAKLLQHAEKELQTVEDVNVKAMLQYRHGMFRMMKSPYLDYDEALQRFRYLGDIADKHEFTSHQILARSYAGLAQIHRGRLSEALELSEDALRMVRQVGKVYSGAQDILFNHAIILRAQKRQTEAAEYFEASHTALMEGAESIQEPSLYRSFLEQVRVNAEITREYRLLHRGESREALAAVHEHNLRTLYEVARKINSVLDLPQLLDHIMDAALEAMNGERGMIFLIESDQLSLKVSRNVERETIRDATEISQSILGDVLRGGKPIVVSDTAKDDAFRNRESVVNYNIHSLICVPMKSKGDIIGTVYVDSRSDVVKSMSFSDIDMEFLEAFANLATIAIENAQLHTRLQEENLYLLKEVRQHFRFENIVGTSAPMQKLFSETEAAMDSNGVVLIYGESGTGKELIAHAIHYNGPRQKHRFVAVDCGAMPDTLLESELFGYKRGAFTGAYTDKQGLFEEAHHGTLFLDEIANTSLAFQAKLLRVLQEGEFRRVGDTVTRHADVRIICATNKDLQEEIAASRFRQDLYFRLNVIPITIPALRERVGDIPLLVEHIIARFKEQNETAVVGSSEELVEYLKQLPWPGNVRELENLLLRMLTRSNDTMLTTKDIPQDYLSMQTTDAGTAAVHISLKPPKRLMTLSEMEREHFQYVLQQTNGNKTEAAKILGLKRTTFVEKMKKLGMM